MKPLIRFPVTHAIKPAEFGMSEAVTLSVIVPVYNESLVIDRFHHRLTEVLDSLPLTSEIIYIDDGSTDNTWDKLQILPESHSEQVLIALSRNFGKEAAMSAGLDASRGEAVIIIDCDLQDPPELIPDMVTCWQNGFDVVNMRRRKRHGESWLKRRSAAIYYRLLNRLSDISIPENVGDFRLLSRKVVDHINTLPEKSRYMKGLFAWPGFRQTEIVFDRAPRLAGESKWPLFKLLNLAMEGITSFSIRPLKLATWSGALIALIAVGHGVFSLGINPYNHSPLITVMLFLGGIQLIAVGLLGEYVGRIFIETKQRPVYLTMKTITRQSTRRAEDSKQRAQG